MNNNFTPSPDLRLVTTVGGTYYCDNTGTFYGRTGRALKGSLNNRGYLQLGVFEGSQQVDKRLHHVLVYETWVGPIPAGLCIDHIDRNCLNNSVSNLRLATHSLNQLNKGTRGAFKVRDNKWLARIKHRGQQYQLGTFSTEGEALAAYAAANKMCIARELASI